MQFFNAAFTTPLSTPLPPSPPPSSELGAGITAGLFASPKSLQKSSAQGEGRAVSLNGGGLPPDFDSGINTSAAWTSTDQTQRATLRLSASPSLKLPNIYASDEEPELNPLSLTANAITNGNDGGQYAGADAGEHYEYHNNDDTGYGLPDPGEGRPARALYSFEGKPEFRELAMNANDELEVVREEVGDGWSLVREMGSGEVGLVPRTYYTVSIHLVTYCCRRLEMMR